MRRYTKIDFKRAGDKFDGKFFEVSDGSQSKQIIQTGFNGTYYYFNTVSHGTWEKIGLSNSINAFADDAEFVRVEIIDGEVRYLDDVKVMTVVIQDTPTIGHAHWVRFVRDVKSLVAGYSYNLFHDGRADDLASERSACFVFECEDSEKFLSLLAGLKAKRGLNCKIIVVNDGFDVL